MSRQSLIDSVKNSDNLTAKKLSKSLIQDLQEIVDRDNSTVLHMAANTNNYDLGQHFVSMYNQLIQSYPEEFTVSTRKKWINLKDNEGFTSLHYAVFRSNYQFAIYLEQHGADLYQINNQGLTVLHIAAQGDCPLLMYYYLSKGLKLQVLDAKGSTPLHWACYSGQQNSAFALISWGAAIDQQEQTFGMTPLHLAVMSGNGRIVKKLLLKGCDRNIRDYNGKLPLDVARQNQYINITQMIIDKRGIAELLNVKTPFRKLHRHTFPFYIFLFLFLSNYILNVSFVVSGHLTSQTSQKDLAICFLVLGFLVLLNYVLCYCSNPGKLRNTSTQSYFQTLLKHKPYTICYDCKIVKPERSRHCQICDTCVSVYDHHCPWIANCVGADNYCYFFTFLINLFVFLAYTVVYELINVCLFNNWSSISPLEVIRTVCQFYGLLCGLFFMIPLIFLLMVQIRNVSENKTTFERYGFTGVKQKRRLSEASNSQVSSLRSSFSHSGQPSRRSALRDSLPQSRSGNCFMMCWGNRNNPLYHQGV